MLNTLLNGRKKEGHFLFNDTPNTFYLQLYGVIVRHMLKDHSDNERGNPFVTPVVEHWLEREIAQWVHHEGSIHGPISPCANALTTELC